MNEELKRWQNEAENAYFKVSKIIGRVNGIVQDVEQKLDFMETEILYVDDTDLLKKVVRQYLDMIRSDLNKIEYETLNTFMRTGKGF